MLGVRLLHCPHCPSQWLRVELQPGQPDRLVCLVCGCRFQVVRLLKRYSSRRWAALAVAAQAAQKGGKL